MCIRPEFIDLLLKMTTNNYEELNYTKSRIGIDERRAFPKLHGNSPQNITQTVICSGKLLKTMWYWSESKLTKEPQESFSHFIFV